LPEEEEEEARRSKKTGQIFNLKRKTIRVAFDRVGRVADSLHHRLLIYPLLEYLYNIVFCV